MGRVSAALATGGGSSAEGDPCKHRRASPPTPEDEPGPGVVASNIAAASPDADLAVLAAHLATELGLPPTDSSHFAGVAATLNVCLVAAAPTKAVAAPDAVGEAA